MFNVDELVEMARKARDRAYAPYSRFKVGAALLLDNGEYVLGCNVENASYGLCNCAERTALFKAYSEGYTKENIVAIAIIGQTVDPISPCGACRQVMVELLKGDTPVILANLEKKTKMFKVNDLLPYSFGGEDL